MENEIRAFSGISVFQYLRISVFHTFSISDNTEIHGIKTHLVSIVFKPRSTIGHANLNQSRIR